MYRDPTGYDKDIRVSVTEILPLDTHNRVKFLCAADENRDSWFRSCGKKSYFLKSPMNQIKSIQTDRIYDLRKHHKHPVDARMFLFEEERYIYYVDAECQMSVVNVALLPTQGVKLVYPGMVRYQKNWVPLVYEDDLYFVTRIVPLKVVRCLDVKSGVCVIHHDEDPEFEWDDKVCFVRGGTNMLAVSEETPHLFIGFAHTTMRNNENWTKLCNYRVLFYVFNFLTLEIQSMSDPVNFWHPYMKELKLNPRMFCRVHFPTVCYFDKQTQDLVVGVDFFDSSSALFTWKSDDLKRFLQKQPDERVSTREQRAKVSKFVYPTMGGLSLVSSWFTWLRVKHKLHKFRSKSN